MMGAGESEWMRGYEAARHLCIAHGPETAQHERLTTPSATFEAGWDWGILDYLDANGLPRAGEARGA